MATTEQKSHPWGQPREARMGKGLMCRAPFTRLRSGQGRSVRDAERRPGRVVDGLAIGGPVGQPSDVLESSRSFQAFHQFDERLLPFAADHVVAELQGFVGQEGHVGPAHYRGDARPLSPVPRIDKRAWLWR